MYLGRGAVHDALEVMMSEGMYANEQLGGTSSHIHRVSLHLNFG